MDREEALLVVRLAQMKRVSRFLLTAAVMAIMLAVVRGVVGLVVGPLLGRTERVLLLPRASVQIVATAHRAVGGISTGILALAAGMR